MPAAKEFTWSADDTIPARLLRFFFPRTPWRYRRILAVHRLYKKFNMRFRNLPATMPPDFHLAYHTSHAKPDKNTEFHVEITATKCIARSGEQTLQQRRDKLPMQWTDKYSDLDREDVAALYETMRKAGCIYFDTEKGTEVSFIGYYRATLTLVANGVQYQFGDSTGEPYYKHWYEESEECYAAVHDLLLKYKIHSWPISKAVPEE